MRISNNYVPEPHLHQSVIEKATTPPLLQNTTDTLVSCQHISSLQEVKTTSVSLHQQLVLIANALGYPIKADAKGVCHGISFMSTQAMLVDDVDTFNKRINLIAALCEKHNNDYSKIAKIIHEDKKLSLEILPFFDGFILMQNSTCGHTINLCPEDILQEDPRMHNMFDLISSPSLTHQQGLGLARSSINFFSCKELQNYLKSIRATAQSCNTPISLAITNHNHVLNLSYIPKKNVWYFSNANNLPIETVYFIHEAATKAFCGLMDLLNPCYEQQIILTINSYTYKKDTSKVYDSLNKDEIIQSFDKITRNQAIYKKDDISLASLLFYKPFENKETLSLLQQLLSHGVDVDSKIGTNTFLSFCCLYNMDESAKLLIENKADFIIAYHYKDCFYCIFPKDPTLKKISKKEMPKTYTLLSQKGVMNRFFHFTLFIFIQLTVKTVLTLMFIKEKTSYIINKIKCFFKNLLNK